LTAARSSDSIPMVLQLSPVRHLRDLTDHPVTDHVDRSALRAASPSRATAT
jgi:hypothetical protein